MDCGFGNGKDWTHYFKNGKIEWKRNKDFWNGQKYIDHLKVKFSNWAKTPEEIKNNYLEGK